MEEELRRLKLERRISDLETVVSRYKAALSESSSLLAQCTPLPRRPAVSHDVKVKLCARQSWCCADPFGTCPLWEISDGRFTEDFLPWHCDHIVPYHTSVQTTDNLQILCVVCHNVKTREERAADLASQRAEREAVGSG